MALIQPFANDWFKNFSKEQYTLEHDATKLATFYEKSPLPHMVQSVTNVSKNRSAPFYLTEKAKAPHANYKDPISLGLGNFSWIPVLDDNKKDIVRNKWPQARECAPPSKDYPPPVEPSEVGLRRPWFKPMWHNHVQQERENETFEQLHMRLKWKGSHMKHDGREKQIKQQNKPLKSNPRLEFCPNQMRFKKYRSDDLCEDWDRLRVAWAKMQLKVRFDDWVHDTYTANPLIKFRDKRSPLVEERMASLKSNTKESTGYKVDYKCRCENMPDRKGEIKKNVLDIDYMRALEDPRMDTMNRTYRTFPIDMLENRDDMRDQVIHPRVRVANIVYNENPYKWQRRIGQTQLGRLKYSDPNYPQLGKEGRYQKNHYNKLAKQ